MGIYAEKLRYLEEQKKASEIAAHPASAPLHTPIVSGIPANPVEEVENPLVTGAQVIVRGVAGVLDLGHTIAHPDEIHIAPHSDTVFETPEITTETYHDDTLDAVNQWRLDFGNALKHGMVDEKLFTFQTKKRTAGDAINFIISKALRRPETTSNEEALSAELANLFLAIPKISVRDPANEWGWTYPDAVVNIPIGSIVSEPANAPLPLIYDLGPKMPEPGEAEPQMTGSRPLLIVGDEDIRGDYFNGVIEAVTMAGSAYYTDGRQHGLHTLLLDTRTYRNHPELALSTLARLEKPGKIGQTIVFIPDLAALEKLVASARQKDPRMAQAPDQRTVAQILHELMVTAHPNVHFMVGIDPNDADKTLTVDEHTGLSFGITLYGPDAKTLNMAPEAVKEAGLSQDVLPHQFLTEVANGEESAVVPVWVASFKR